jgi:hypothetical protein
MKIKLLSLVFALCSALTGVAQIQPFQMGFGYVYTAPTGGMKQYIKHGDGFIWNAYWTVPSQRVSLGFEANRSMYAWSTSTQDYTFPDGVVAPMDINVSNSFINRTGNLRVFLLTKGHVRPYTEVKFGYSQYKTTLTIVDPNDQDDCAPVDKEILKKDGNAMYSIGGGVRVDLAAFSRYRESGKWFLDFSVNAMQGGRVDYMNTNAPSTATPHHTTTRSTEVEAEFINTQTQVVHKHHVGYVYNSFIQATDFRLSLSFALGPYRQTVTAE